MCTYSIAFKITGLSDTVYTEDYDTSLPLMNDDLEIFKMGVYKNLKCSDDKNLCINVLSFARRLDESSNNSKRPQTFRGPLHTKIQVL
jgi:hypothetical protein